VKFKKLLVLFCMLMLNIAAFSNSVIITEVTGWLESALVKWQPANGASSYNVYYSGQGITNRKIDNQLIRSYGSYIRADIPGLSPGSYTIKVAPVIQGTEGSATITNAVTVLAHDRNGFAFANNRVPGAYKADGTPKDNAVIIYLTEKNKNTLSVNITGATTNPCVGIQTILDGIKKGKDNRPFIIRMIGQVKDAEYMLNGDLVIENNNNAASFITFEGIGDDAVADGWGLRIKNASNVEVRNIGTMNCDSGEGDNIGLQQDNDYIWVHHCDLFYGNAGSDADQIKGDGALDCKKSTYVTFSYNHFWDTGKSQLLGLGEGTTDGLFITFHHNWYDHADSRHPRVRYYSAHVYNNYYDGIAKYGVGSTLGSSVFVENNFFRNCKYPMLTSMQGTDIFYDGEGTFSGEDGGTIKAFNNTMSGQTRFVTYHPTNFPVEFDAVNATTRSEVVAATIKSKKGANSYNNFDTNPAHYILNLIPDDPETAKNKVITYAGRIQGGDFKWTFNNAVDDVSYAVNTAMKSALSGYKTTLVAIQGEETSTGSSQTLTSTNNISQTVSTGIAIEQIVFTWGGDATDASVTGLPASGLIITKNATAKTITISGTPTANVSYSVTTSGATGTPATLSGTITVTTGGNTGGDYVHNFTASGKTSTYFSITGNLSTSYGTVNYAGLTLTQCLKMESSTVVSFTASSAGSLTLVFNSAYTGSVNIDGTSYTPSAGIITLNLNAGQHTIMKGSGSNYLFYMSFAGLNATEINQQILISLQPNPVSDRLLIEGTDETLQVSVYNLAGREVMRKTGVWKSLDISGLSEGMYLVRISDGKHQYNFKINKY
jgi:pectate lyase